jgi:hypothetical protein
MMALGWGDVPGVNDQFSDWCKSCPKRAIGIVFLQFPLLRRKRTTNFGWSNNQLENSGEIIDLVIGLHEEDPLKT